MKRGRGARGKGEGSLGEVGMRAFPICRLRPLDAVLSSGLCGKEGALPPVTGLTVQRIICC